MSQPQQALAAALPVLRERSIQLSDFCLHSPLAQFYGLGWDFAEEQFKIYFRVTQLSQLPPDLLLLLEGYALAEHSDEGLLSFTFIANLPSETKVYLYPRNADLPAGAQREARMLSDRRGMVAQYDVEKPAEWFDKINETGQNIVRLYHGINEELDTIAYQDRDHYTLYFP